MADSKEKLSKIGRFEDTVAKLMEIMSKKALAHLVAAFLMLEEIKENEKE